MNDQAIKEGFTYGAGDVNPPAVMWEQIAREMATRPARRVWTGWRTITSVAASLLLVFSLTLALSPGARAAAAEAWAHLFQTIWSGQVGGEQAELRWADDAKRSELEQAGMQFGIPYITVNDVDEAVARIGFRPPLPSSKEAILKAIKVAAVPRPGADSEEVRFLTLDYELGSARYSIGVHALYKLVDGQWTLEPPKMLESTIVGSQAPKNARTVSLGGTKALCFELHPGATSCNWLQDGRGVGIIGPDPAKVVELAKTMVP